MDKMSVKILKERYASGETPRDIVNEIINLSSEYQDRNIWIVPPDMRFIEPYLKVLDNADRSLPLWGIPFAVKDNIDVVGLPTTAGLQALSSIPEKSAEAVSRLVCAGAIPVGKTNLDQLATGLTGTRSPYGECKNAVTPEYISGGSSSGSAVAAALGLCSFALGTDTGGSVRVPAALNGIYGFKPYIGAYPKSGIVPACESIDCAGLLARSLDDISAADAVIRGYDENDAYSRVMPQTTSEPEKYLVPIFDDNSCFFGSLHMQYRDKFSRIVKSISAELPTERVNIDIFIKVSEFLFEGIFASERWSSLCRIVTQHEKSLLPVTRSVLLSCRNRSTSTDEFFAKQHELMNYKLEVRKMLKGKVIVLPTTGGTFTRNEIQNDPFGNNKMLGIFTNHGNILDLSALSVPFGSIKTESCLLPFGITLYTLPEQEKMLFAAANKIKNTEK